MQVLKDMSGLLIFVAGLFALLVLTGCNTVPDKHYDWVGVHKCDPARVVLFDTKVCMWEWHDVQQ